MQTQNIHHWYGPTHFHIGAGCVDGLKSSVKQAGMSSVLLVTSQSIAADADLIQPVLDGLGDIPVTVFKEVSIKKQLDTVQSASNIIEESAIDGIVSIGGGSTADAASAISVVAATDADPKSLFAAVDSDGQIQVSGISPTTLPVIAVPTTLSGAEVTCAAGMNIGDAERGSRRVRSAPIISSEIWPEAVFYDPQLAAKTPDRILGPSAMNGLDHGIEMLYSRNRTPFTDATAAQGVRILNGSIPVLLDDNRDLETITQAMTGIALATTGLIDPISGAKYSLIHAFGHQLSQRYDIQQGQAHGVIAPAVLDYVFSTVEYNQDMLSWALGSKKRNDQHTYIVERVTALRNALRLPTHLHSLDGLSRNDFPVLSEAIQNDIGIRFGPVGLAPSTDEIEDILAAAW